MRRWRRVFGFARRRARPLMGVVIGVISLTVIGGVISSCRDRGKLEEAVQLAPSPGVIRVRLREQATSASAGAAGPYRLLVDGVAVAGSSAPLAAAPLERRGEYWILGGTSVAGRLLRIEPTSAGGLVECDGRPYRGALVVRPSDAGPDRFDVDNHVGLEAYLAGVLARELPHGWHEEAYKSQAVAARTYALYEMRHDGRRRSFDVYADQRSQVYGGASDETAKSLDAVRQTRGQVLVVGTGGADHIFKAYYSSCCGGMTNPADGLEPQDEAARPLAGGVPCTDCARSARYRWPAVNVSKADVYQALARCYTQVALLGGLREIRVRNATGWGRAELIELVSPDGRTSRIRADDLRLALLRFGPPGARELYSMNCTIRDSGDGLVFENGRGFGHGVGLCQYGAQGKALRGMRYHEILYAYYPGARIAQMQ